MRISGLVATLIITSLLLISPHLGLHAQSGDFTLSARPALTVPLGPELDNGTAYYTTGGGLSLDGLYTPAALPLLRVGLGFDASLMPINGSDQSATFISIAPTVGLAYSPGARLLLGLRGFGGLYTGIIEAGTIRDPYYGAGASVGYQLNPGMSITLDADYRDYMTSGDSALQGISVGLGIRYAIGSSSSKAELYYAPELLPIFPLFYSYYETQPAGLLSIENRESSSVSAVEVSFFVKQFMDQPKSCATIERLPAGESVECPIYALFSEEIFRVTEGTKVAGELTIEYDYIGRRITESVPVTVTVNNRNAMTWDDDRKAAAFVTAKDPLILSFAKNVAATVGSDTSAAINENFRFAMGIFEALSLYGLGYVQDPTTPYAELSEDNQALDYLQFPNQTIAFKSGDCDDISILYAALLEAVGIETAFVTAPGHIYLAFSLGMTPVEAGKVFLDTRELIFLEEDTWVPVEITLVREGFLKAWQIGAKEWRETKDTEDAGFFPVRSAWELYEPVGFSEGGAGIILPDSVRLLDEYRKELSLFVNRQIDPRVIELNAQIASSSNPVWARNRLGILYARFGKLDDAAAQFRQVLGRSQYVPAMINLGNIHLIQDDPETARDYYARAKSLAPTNKNALLGLARANYDLERYSEADQILRELEAADPATAAEFAYLGSGSTETGRASQALNRTINAWDEEE